MGPRSRPVRRALVGILVSIVGMVLLVEGLAARNVGRARAARAHLGGMLHVEESGTGATLVLLAGFQGSTRFWDPVAPQLSMDRRVVRIDALGFGRSPWPDAAYTLEEHVGALHRTVAARASGEKVTIVGHSFGALLAAHEASRHPESVARIVLLGTPVFDSPEEGRRRVRKLSPLAAFFSFHPLLARESCQLLCAFRPVAGGLATFARRDLPEMTARDAVLHDWQSFRGTLENVVLGPSIREPLAVVAEGRSVRIVFVHGTSDRVTDIDEVRSLADQLGAGLFECSASHSRYLEDCREEFLSALDSTAPRAGGEDAHSTPPQPR